ncbi:flagellar hook-length control protein FliK [Natranaerovirga hydrolytica]|uniref:Flagellar hook-length control protein FliK n=1 Tax=Natranaerovirga hydrolytica TaxID=680378 RepID=A0A4R1N5K3_9FIRM|nr:flagellar hook-length control protein FliK [Natranaerovirga hydrolytica]TCK97893.1 flagellar hook-length control protein FliK [Natranaerovirga hydrolytica]
MNGFVMLDTQRDFNATVDLKSSRNPSNNRFDDIMKNVSKNQSDSNTNHSKAEKTNNSQENDNTNKKVTKGSNKNIKTNEKEENLEMDKEKTLEKIVEIITETLGISEEQLYALLDQLELELDDLIIADNLQLLTIEALEVKDMIEVLTDGELSLDIKNMFQEIKEIGKAIEKNIENNAAIVEETALNNDLGSSKQERNTNVVVQGDTHTTDNKHSEEQLETAKAENVKEKEITFDVHLEKDNSKSNQEDSSKQSDLSNSFMDKLSKQLEGKMSVEVEPLGQDENFSYEKIIKQLVNQIKVQIKPEVTKMEFQLNPEHLGKVNFMLTSEQGLVSARFVAQNQLVKDTIETQVFHLRETLEEQGIKVDKIEVVLANEAFNHEKQDDSQKNNEQESSKKGMKIIKRKDLLGEDAMEEESDVSKEKETDSVIDYTA